jgi:valyl-tRNA synthetase
VWYCEDRGTPSCAEPIVRRSAPARCPHCNGTRLRQDEDVLDTWFSSWLWPFSVHNWPNQSEEGTGADLRYFYPTDLLVTAPEIIFFWVARMIMSGLKFGPDFTGSTDPAKNIPFRDVYFTSIVRDEKGRKMSKSLGNSPEPLDLIATYGADAVRFTTLYLAPLGQDVLYAVEKNEIGRNFANKIWNAGRFLLMNRDQIGEADGTAEFETRETDLADRWVLSRLHSTIRDVETGMAAYEVNKVAKLIFDFFWHDFADWYIEMVKSRLYGDEPEATKKIVLRRAIDVFDAALRLLHPLMPFVTEELWQNIRPRRESDTIMRSPLPACDRSLIDQTVESEMAFVQRVIEEVRTIRGEVGIPPSRDIELQMHLTPGRGEASIRRYSGYLQRLARVATLTVRTGGGRPPTSMSAVVDGEELFVPLGGLIDVQQERARLGKEIDRLTAMAAGVRAKLENQAFVGKAPADVVQREREKLQSFTLTLEKLHKNLQALD